jgi:hypothetical protein
VKRGGRQLLLFHVMMLKIGDGEYGACQAAIGTRYEAGVGYSGGHSVGVDRPSS